MIYKFNYGSEVQSATGQDIETKEFRTIDQMIDYAKKRLPDDFGGVYTVMFEAPYLNPSHVEFPSALITRNEKELILYLQKRWFFNDPCNLFIFEWNSYDEALKYLYDFFETSSIMYDNEE